MYHCYCVTSTANVCMVYNSYVIVVVIVVHSFLFVNINQPATVIDTGTNSKDSAVQNICARDK